MDATYSPGYPGVAKAETIRTPEVTPAVYLTIPEASQRVYERGSIAETIQRMFKEIDENPGLYAQAEQEQKEYAWNVHPHDPEAYQTVMWKIQKNVENSDAVQDLIKKVEYNSKPKNAENKKPITASDVETVFRAYEHAFRAAVAAVKSAMSAKQMNVLKFQTQSELDYSFRDVITRHLIAGSEGDMKVDPLDFFLLLNPKARKIDYMSNKEILATLRHSMSIPAMSVERLKHDVRAVESISHRSEYQELQSSHEVQSIRSSIHV